jgi:hypothetical protein
MIGSEKMKPAIIIAMLAIIISIPRVSTGQSSMPEILQDGTLQEQLDYIEERTLIYNNFRAIREDMFLQVKRNSLDSLAGVKRVVNRLTADLNSRDVDLDSLSALLDDTRDDLDHAIRNRDNIAFLGIPMSKTAYNLLVWIIIAGLTTLLILGSLIFKRNLIVTSRALRELNELNQEFENYRKSSREKREKLVMEHFNEIKRLKES